MGHRDEGYDVVAFKLTTEMAKVELQQALAMLNTGQQPRGSYKKQLSCAQTAEGELTAAQNVRDNFDLGIENWKIRSLC